MEDIIAFSGIARLWRWTDGSGSGPRVKFLLETRDELDHFAETTRRRGKRAGQRYAISYASLEDPPREHFEEAWFMGANWSHQDGASIHLQINHDTLDWLRQFNAKDSSPDADGDTLALYMVELNDDDKPINQRQADAAEKLKGGPKSKFVAMRYHRDDFKEFVSVFGNEGETPDELVKRVCVVDSKVEFDHDPQAWDRYERLINKAFLRWSSAEEIT